jgi:hypothetical protein
VGIYMKTIYRQVLKKLQAKASDLQCCEFGFLEGLLYICW